MIEWSLSLNAGGIKQVSIHEGSLEQNVDAWPVVSTTQQVLSSRSSYDFLCEGARNNLREGAAETDDHTKSVRLFRQSDTFCLVNYCRKSQNQAEQTFAPKFR